MGIMTNCPRDPSKLPSIDSDSTGTTKVDILAAPTQWIDGIDNSVLIFLILFFVIILVVIRYKSLMSKQTQPTPSSQNV